MKIQRCLKLIFALTLITNLHTFSQKLDTPLKPFDNSENANFIGGQLGIGQNFQSGKFFANCIACEFSGGVGLGYDFSIFFEQEIERSKLLWGASVGLNGRNIQSKFTEVESLPFYLTDGSFYDSIPLNIENTADIKLSTVSLVPYVKYLPLNFLALRLGPSFSFVTNNNITHSQAATKSTLTLQNGQTAKIKTINGTIQDSEISQLNSMILGLDFQIAFPMHLGPKWTFAPVFSYNLPFANISEYGQDFRINSWRLLLELKYQLNGRYESKTQKK